MIKKLTAIVCLLVLTSFAAPRASADVIFSQGPLDGGGSLICDEGWVFLQQGADDFVLDSDGGTVPAYYVADIHWWGSYGEAPDPSTTDDFNIRFFEDVAGSPSETAFYDVDVGAVSRTPTGMSSSAWLEHDGGDVYLYEVFLPAPILLDADTTYYLALMNDTSSRWGWSEDGPGAFWYRAEGVPWNYYGMRQRGLAFELTGQPIPEPTTMLMLGGLGAGLAGARKLRRKK